MDGESCRDTCAHMPHIIAKDCIHIYHKLLPIEYGHILSVYNYMKYMHVIDTYRINNSTF